MNLILKQSPLKSGILEDPATEADEHVYSLTTAPEDAPDVADKIVNMDKDGNDCPLEKVVMTKITLE